MWYWKKTTKKPGKWNCAFVFLDFPIEHLAGEPWFFFFFFINSILCYLRQSISSVRDCLCYDRESAKVLWETSHCSFVFGFFGVFLGQNWSSCTFAVQIKFMSCKMIQKSFKGFIILHFFTVNAFTFSATWRRVCFCLSLINCFHI